MSKLIVKVNYGKELRKISIPATDFKMLETSVCKLLTLKQEQIILKYVDEEQDLITLTSQPELEEAVKSLKLQPEPVLKLFVFLKQPFVNNNSQTQPTEQKPVEQKPVEQKPAEQKPAEQKPAEQPKKETQFVESFPTPQYKPTPISPISDLIETFNSSFEYGCKELMSRAKEATDTLTNQANNVVSNVDSDFIVKMLQFFEQQIQTFFKQADVISRQLTLQLQSSKNAQEAQARAEVFQKIVHEQFQTALNNIQFLATQLSQQVGLLAPQPQILAQPVPEPSLEPVPIPKIPEASDFFDHPDDLASFVVIAPEPKPEEPVAQPKPEPVVQPKPEPVVVVAEPHSNELQQLADMGFTDKELNTRLLKKHNNNVLAVITEILG